MADISALRVQPVFLQEDGRRHLLEGYGFMNDAQEGARQILEHDLLNLDWGGKLYSAPLQALAVPPRMILDVACGTGIWGRLLALGNPNAQVVNIDLDNVLFDQLTKKVPAQSNVFFLQADARNRLPFPNGSFQFTHARLPEFLSNTQWPPFIRELARVTDPEGWVEIVTYGKCFTGLKALGKDEASDKLFATGLEDAKVHGVTLGGLQFEEHLRQAGVGVPVKVKVAGKGSKQRDLALRNVLHLYRQLKPSFLSKGLMTEEAFESCIAQFEHNARTTGFKVPYLCACFQPKDMTPAVHTC